MMRANVASPGPILVIDDDPDIRATVVAILEAEGYGVEQAAHGAAALSILERVQPALVLLDMRMPVMDGWEFARSLRERGDILPIVVMTAAHSASRWAEEIKAAGYIAKPFMLDDLLDTVERFVSTS